MVIIVMTVHNAEKYSFSGWLKNIHPSIIILLYLQLLSNYNNIL